MAGKRVAKKGDVKAEAGSKLYGQATTGSWSPGDISETRYPNLTTGGGEVVYEAKCKFSFTGTKPVPGGTAPENGTSDVTVKAKTTLLQAGQSRVLVDGNDNKDKYDNKLYVSASNKLKSA
jgi:hypothetical protein